MRKIDPAVSEYMRQLNSKRKKRVGGFSDPKVQAKIREIRNAKRKEKERSQT